MISIYLCEDSQQQLAQWTQIIKNYLLINELNEAIAFATKNPNLLVAQLRASPPEVGLYFLDIGLKDKMNGLQLASQIRKLDPRGYIVFITSHSEMSYMTFQYKVEAMDFILKDHVEELPTRICQCLEAAYINYCQLKQSQNKQLKIEISGQTLFLDTDTIFLLESDPNAAHKILIHTETGLKSVYGTLKEFESVLTTHKEFIRCSRSLIVNMSFVKQIFHIEKKGILTNGEHFFISSHYIKKLSEYKNASQDQTK